TRNLMLIQQSKRKKRAESGPSIFIFSGERSADLYGGLVIEALRKRAPQATLFGVGGPAMRAQGFESMLPMETFQVMGFSDVIKALPRLLLASSKICGEILKREPEVLLFIDQPDHSMRMAKKLRTSGYQGKIVQLVAPTVWAWRKGRAEV